MDVHFILIFHLINHISAVSTIFSRLLVKVKLLHPLRSTRRVPVEGKSSVCLICMKYRIIIVIIIIISLGQILLSYIANTSRTHANVRTHTHTHMRAHTHTPAVATAIQVSAIHRRPPVAARSAGIHSP